MLRTKKRVVLLLLALLGAAAVVYGVTRIRSSAPALATAQAVRGDLDIVIKTRGEVKAQRSVTLIAPTSVTDIQIVSLVPAGTLVKQDDVVIQLDITSQQDRLNQRMSAIKQVDAEMDRLMAQNRIQDEQDSLDLAQAQFNVESAKLDVSKQEIVSQIDAEKAKLALNNTERALEEVKARMAAHKLGQQADADAIRQRRVRADNDAKLTQSNIERMTIRSPLAGLVQIMPNFRAGSRMYGAGGSAPEFKQGDSAWPGAGIAEIPDLASLSVELAVEETDRGRVAAGQKVRVKVDALSDRLIAGVIESISPLSQINYSARPPQKTFRANVKLDLSKLEDLIKVKPKAEAAKAETGSAAGASKAQADARSGAAPSGSRGEGRRSSDEGGARAGGLQSDEVLKKLRDKGIDPEELMKKIREGGEARAQALQQLKENGIDLGGGARRPREGSAEGSGSAGGPQPAGAAERGTQGEGRGRRRGATDEARGEGDGRQAAMPGDSPGAPAGGPPAAGSFTFAPPDSAPRSGNDSGRAPQSAAANPAKRADSSLRPGMSAGGDIVVEVLKNVVLIPVRATFDRGGKAIVYVRKGRDFEPREIVTGRKGEALVEVVKGLQPGEVVALEEPASAKAKKS